MIYNYFDFIKEGTSDSKDSEGRPIYWKNQLSEIFDKEWIEFSTAKYKGNLGEGIYFIKFKVNDGGKYPFNSILVKNEAGGDVYILENGISDDFIRKFKTEFFKNVKQYVPEFNKLKFKPKCLGDWNQIEMSVKYNI